jgi:hypothetical protein
MMMNINRRSVVLVITLIILGFILLFANEINDDNSLIQNSDENLVT